MQMKSSSRAFGSAVWWILLCSPTVFHLAALCLHSLRSSPRPHPPFFSFCCKQKLVALIDPWISLHGTWATLGFAKVRTFHASLWPISQQNQWLTGKFAVPHPLPPVFTPFHPSRPHMTPCWAHRQRVALWLCFGAECCLLSADY